MKFLKIFLNKIGASKRKKPNSDTVFINDGGTTNSQTTKILCSFGEQKKPATRVKTRIIDTDESPTSAGDTDLTLVRSPASGEALLTNVPLEILAHIAKFLPSHSAAALSITSRSIYHALGTQYVTAFRRDPLCHPKSIEKFLEMLERDLDDHVLCHNCKKFHAIKDSFNYGRVSLIRWEKTIDQEQRPCWNYMSSLRCGHFLTREFSLPLFQMIMKLYRQGREYSPLIGYLSGAPKTEYVADGWFQQIVSLARVIEATGTLVLRQQTILSPTLLSGSYLDVPNKGRYEVCVHVCAHTVLAPKDGLTAVNHLRTQYSKPNKEVDWNVLTKCKYCVTEYQVNLKKIWGTHAIVVTKWQDLGQAKSLEDENWERATNDSHTYSEQVTFDKGSICAAFEGHDSSEFVFDRNTI